MRQRTLARAIIDSDESDPHAPTTNLKRARVLVRRVTALITQHTTAFTRAITVAPSGNAAPLNNATPRDSEAPRDNHHSRIHPMWQCRRRCDEGLLAALFTRAAREERECYAQDRAVAALLATHCAICGAAAAEGWIFCYDALSDAENTHVSWMCSVQ